MIDEKALVRAVKRAMENAGTLPAKEAVKLVPADWHRICAFVLGSADESAKPKEALKLGSRLTVEGVEAVVVPLWPSTTMLAAAQKEWLADPARKSSTLYRAMLSAAGDGR